MGLVVHARLGAAHTSLLAASLVATVAMRSDAFIVDKLTESGVSGPASGVEHCSLKQMLHAGEHRVAARC
jgi:hypothetical protein